VASQQIKWDAGSFRDPAGSVFFAGNSVYRSVSDQSEPDIKKLIDSDFFQRMMRDGQIVLTQLVENTFDVPGTFVLKHDTIPFMNYPYEWSFNMLKDAALLTLGVLKKCIENDFILKDGTAWNVTLHKGKMIFFDVMSIEKYAQGQTWNGYQQFCNEFLYPLFLKAYKDVPFQPIFKGSLTGIDPVSTQKVFKTSDIFKCGILKHLFLNAYLSKNKKISSTKINREIKLPKLALLSMIENLKNTIQKLKCVSDNSVWIDYAENNTYEKEDENNKINFIKAFCTGLPKQSSIVDFGCNTGNYSRVVVENHTVFSCDIDEHCIDQLYKKSVHDKIDKLTPIVLDLMHPSANVGWHLQERKSIFERLKCDGFLSLALIHHICIANNVPLELFVKILHSVAHRGVLEWVSKEDPMVQFLLRNRHDVFDTYTWDNFETIVGKYFKIEKTLKVNNGCRTLCWLEPLE